MADDQFAPGRRTKRQVVKFYLLNSGKQMFRTRQFQQYIRANGGPMVSRSTIYSVFKELEREETLVRRLSGRNTVWVLRTTKEE